MVPISTRRESANPHSTCSIKLCSDFLIYRGLDKGRPGHRAALFFNYSLLMRIKKYSPLQKHLKTILLSAETITMFYGTGRNVILSAMKENL